MFQIVVDQGAQQSRNKFSTLVVKIVSDRNFDVWSVKKENVVKNGFMVTCITLKYCVQTLHG